MQESVGPQDSQRGSIALSTASKEDTQQISLQQLFKQLHTSEKGLTSEEARQKLKEVGPNELGAVQRLTGLKQLLLLFTNPLVLILLVASIVSAVFGEVLDASIIIVIVSLSIALNYFQTHRSERAVEGLRKQVAITATALRGGNWVEIPRSELVPGDIIRLTAGDLVPADARLLQTVYLNVQQAALTGESLPVEKDASDSASTSGNLADVRSAVFLGTSIVSGSATAVVTGTGKNTAFGDIVVHLARRPPQTEFEHGVKNFSLLISRTVFFLVVFVFLVGIIFHKGTLDSALFAIALAVGLTPEFLPMIVTITLAQGASRMARQKVIVKHLESIQNFGSIDVLCSDKTGTLTTGEMALSDCFDPQGQPSKRVLLFAYLNSFYETGIKSPLDAAVLRYEQLDVSSYRKLGEIPFDFERRRLSVVVEQAQNGEPLLICKGAPESVLPVCSRYEIDGQFITLVEKSHVMCKETYQKLSAQGYYTIAVAYRPLPPQQELYRASDEQNMILLGYLACFDPPREDASYIQIPQRWNIKLIRDFMVFIGPVSSIFDFLTFFVLLAVFHASAELFHTGWFVESLATQTLVLFVIRTVGNPLRSRPSKPLTITVILVVLFGLIIPYTPLAGPLKFVPLPGLYYLFLAIMIIAYLLLVEVVKRRLMRRLVR